MKTFSDVTIKKCLRVFSANVGHHFFKYNSVGHHFCPDIQDFFRDFVRIFDKSKLLGVRLHLHLHLLHHCFL